MHNRKNPNPSRTRYYRKPARLFDLDPGEDQDDDEREDPINGAGEDQTVNE